MEKESTVDLLRQRIKDAQLSQRAFARFIEVSDRDIRAMCAGSLPIPRYVMICANWLSTPEGRLYALERID